MKPGTVSPSVRQVRCYLRLVRFLVKYHLIKFLIEIEIKRTLWNILKMYHRHLGSEMSTCRVFSHHNTSGAVARHFTLFHVLVCEQACDKFLEFRVSNFQRNPPAVTIIPR